MSYGVRSTYVNDRHKYEVTGSESHKDPGGMDP